MAQLEKPEGAEDVERAPDSIANDARPVGCDGKVEVSERGNAQYAWYYLTNNADADATVTIKRRWLYEGGYLSDTKQHILFPGEEKEVFSFPRNQNPTCTIIRCSLPDEEIS